MYSVPPSLSGNHCPQQNLLRVAPFELRSHIFSITKETSMWGFQKHPAVPTVLSVLLMGLGVLPATSSAQEDATAGTTATAENFMVGGYARVYSQWNLS